MIYSCLVFASRGIFSSYVGIRLESNLSCLIFFSPHWYYTLTKKVLQNVTGGSWDRFQAGNVYIGEILLWHLMAIIVRKFLFNLFIILLKIQACLLLILGISALKSLYSDIISSENFLQSS